MTDNTLPGPGSPDPAAVADLLRQRRTINDFKPEPVPRAVVEAAVETARWAPNHRLSEPWHFYLLGETAITELKDLIVELKSAGKAADAREVFRRRVDAIPTWLVVTSKLSPGDSLREQEDYAATCCAIHNLTLFLWSAGVGCKWTTGGATRDSRMYSALNIDRDRESIAGLIYCGYPLQVPEQRRRAVEEILTTVP